MSPAQLLELALAQDQEHAVILLDADARVASWFDSAARTFGWTGEEMLGQTLDCMFTPEDLARGDLDWELRAARSYGKAEDDRWQVRRDGARIWATGVVTGLRDAAGKLVGFSKVLRDRTDLRAQVETLQARLGEASHGEHQKHVLLGTLAHELRNPLGPLSNAAQIIRLAAPDTPQIAASVQVIQRQVRFIESLVKDLLEETRIGVGKVQLHYETINVRTVIENAIETCSTALSDQGQAVELVLPQALTIDGDPVRLQQVLVNLITNSSKFSPAGSRIWVKATVEADEAVIRVEDHGQGIPAEFLPRIFELFTQSGSNGETAGQGLGLGLGVVKAIVEMHGGTVQARSEGRDKGAEIIVHLPVRRRAPVGGAVSDPQ